MDSSTTFVPHSAQNDNEGAQNDKGGAHNDKGGAQNDKGGAHNDKGGAHNDKGGAHNDNEGAQIDKAETHNDKGGAWNDKSDAHNDNLINFEKRIPRYLLLKPNTFMNQRSYYVYILSSQRNGTLYIGVTNNLVRRLEQHKNKLVAGFTARYDVDKLMLYEIYGDVRDAIEREKQLKGWSRKKKIALFEKENPQWRDLSEDF